MGLRDLFTSAPRKDVDDYARALDTCRDIDRNGARGRDVERAHKAADAAGAKLPGGVRRDVERGR